MPKRREERVIAGEGFTGGKKTKSKATPSSCNVERKVARSVSTLVLGEDGTAAPEVGPGVGLDALEVNSAGLTVEVHL